MRTPWRFCSLLMDLMNISHQKTSILVDDAEYVGVHVTAPHEKTGTLMDRMSISTCTCARMGVALEELSNTERVQAAR